MDIAELLAHLAQGGIAHRPDTAALVAADIAAQCRSKGVTTGDVIEAAPDNYPPELLDLVVSELLADFAAEPVDPFVPPFVNWGR